ncbi:hypothetical protein R1flu_019003 [Riccia fluitans]|uniref:Uncharacterized protein n=1 Tax=Riccia fluitans TaxID=41844 RepID=A0ABD1ZHR6_9MARC
MNRNAGTFEEVTTQKANLDKTTWLGIGTSQLQEHANQPRSRTQIADGCSSVETGVALGIMMEAIKEANRHRNYRETMSKPQGVKRGGNGTLRRGQQEPDWSTIM